MLQVEPEGEQAAQTAKEEQGEDSKGIRANIGRSEDEGKRADHCIRPAGGFPTSARAVTQGLAAWNSEALVPVLTEGDAPTGWRWLAS